jgi:hypothetical protein
MLAFCSLSLVSSAVWPIPYRTCSTVVKPVAGILDLTSKTLEGIRNTATVFDVKRERFRVPRSFGPHGELRPFHSGIDLLCYAQGGAFRNDTFVSLHRIEDARTVVVSNRRVLCVDSTGRALYQVPLSDIATVSTALQSVTMQMTPAARGQQSGMPARVVRCADAAAAAKLADDVMRARAAAAERPLTAAGGAPGAAAAAGAGGREAAAGAAAAAAATAMARAPSRSTLADMQ